MEDLRREVAGFRHDSALIVGAGVTGLATAAALSETGDDDYLVIEADDEIGDDALEIDRATEQARERRRAERADAIEREPAEAVHLGPRTPRAAVDEPACSFEPARIDAFGQTPEEVQILARLRRGEHIDHFETVRVAKNGRRVDISLTVSPLHDKFGSVIGASKVGRDISARKRSEAALRDADRRKDEFLAMLSHELRNPLAPIRNSLHLMRMAEPGSEDALRARTIIERQVIRDIFLNFAALPTAAAKPLAREPLSSFSTNPVRSTRCGMPSTRVVTTVPSSPACR